MKDPKGPIKPYRNAEEIAKKHNVSLEYIKKQVEMGTKIEFEHTTSKKNAEITALQHLDELPDYYTRLKKMEAKKSSVKESAEENRQLLSGKRYCLLCNKHETESQCSWGPKMWNKYSIATVHPANESYSPSMNEGAAWTKKEGKSEKGGLNEKGRKSYEAENPGSDLKAPSKTVGNPRRASFCARMKGMKDKLTSDKTANDPDSRINKSLRAWNC